MIPLVSLMLSLSGPPVIALPGVSEWYFPLQVGPSVGTDAPLSYLLMAITVIGVVIFVLGGVILGKSWLELRRDRRNRAIRRSVRDAFYDQLAEPNPKWDSLVTSLSDVERDVLVEELSRSAELLIGAKTGALRGLAKTLGLREEAKVAVESDSRYRRLWGLKMFIRFGWSADPEWLSEAISQDRDEGEAAIRVLANSPDRITRLAGIDLALQYDGLSVYGMQALHRLVREDPAPLLEQLSRQDITDYAILAQLLRVLAHSDTFTGEAPMDGVLDCLDHDSPAVRRAACSSLAKYGWRPDVRDRVDLMITNLFDDSSTAVRTEAYQMLGKWGDTAAHAKLARAAESETDSRALFVIATLLEETDDSIEQNATGSIPNDFKPWAGVGEIGPTLTQFPE